MTDKKNRLLTPKHPFADFIGLSFESVSPGDSRCFLDADEKLHNPQNALNGGILYSMADTGMAAALYLLLDKDEYCATIEMKISYFKPVVKGRVECASKLINKGKNVASLEAEITHNGKLTAKASGSFAIFKPKKTTLAKTRPRALLSGMRRLPEPNGVGYSCRFR